MTSCSHTQDCSQGSQPSSSATPSDDAAILLDALKARLTEVSEFIDVRRPVLYLDYPVYLNFGDILIMQGTEGFFAEHGYEVTGRYSCINFPERMFGAIHRETTIVLQGGGNFGDLYPTYQRFRERVIAAFPDHRIVMLPQSLHFASRAALERSAENFRQHRKLTLLGRDPYSVGVMRERFCANSHLMPDMAHQLWSRTTRRPGRRATLNFLRADKEAGVGLVPAELDDRPAFDWIDLMTRRQRRVFRRILVAHHREARTQREAGAARAWYRHCEDLGTHLEGVFLDHESVVTNRLHAMLFALLLGRRVAFIDNDYGKLSRYVDAWLRGLAQLACLRRSPTQDGTIT